MKTITSLVMGTIGSLIALSVGTGSAQALSISSTVDQSGFSDFSATPYPLTGASSPFDFTSTAYNSLTTITDIAISLTIEDGDSAPFEFDFDQLTLALDGFNTGIKLNGFADDSVVTATLSGSPLNAASILAALQADGKLIATILDASPDDNLITFPRTFQTTLTLADNAAAIPTPALLPGLIGLGVGVMRKRKGRAA